MLQGREGRGRQRRSPRSPVSRTSAPSAAGAIVGSLANITMSLAGADAAKALLVLPQEANVWGMRDVGGSPDLLPGHRAANDEAARAEVRRVWGAEIAIEPPARPTSR